MTTEPFREARFVTVNGVADLLRVSRTTVYQLIRQGDLPAVRVGCGYRSHEEVVDRHLAGRYPDAG